MNAPSHSQNESNRLAALRRYQVLDTPPEESFDAIVRLAARICNTPISLVTLIDEARQWFKARYGLSIEQTPREIAFCAHAIEGQELCTVPDALTDERFRHNPLVLGEPQIRFYAGVPLVTDDGFALGTLCVIDRSPRPGLTAHQRESLELLAREAMVQLELRRALKELSDTKRAVDTMNVELDAFGAAVAHDLRAPVRHINSFIEMLADECASNSEATQYVDRIRTACARMRDIIDALLRLSRTSHTELTPQTVDLSALAREAAADLRTTEPERHIDIVIQDGVTARGDAALLRVAIGNLLSNAWKFTRSSPQPRIEFGCERVGERIEYFVRDNGVGFDPAVALLPARPFKRHQSGEGVGLGLTIVERTVKRHGGTLRAEGVVGEGAKFSFTLDT